MAKEVTPADVMNKLDEIDLKLDSLLERFGKPVEVADATPMTTVREGDHKYMPTEHELRKRAEQNPSHKLVGQA